MSLGLTALLVACSGSANKPKPTALEPLNSPMAFKQAWTVRLGAVNFPLAVATSGTTLITAASDGQVTAVNGLTGAELWRMQVGAALAAGVGSDGRITAVVTQANDLVAMDGGREVWRQKLSAHVYSAPFVAGGRVFVLSADRSVHAFDGLVGRKLWSQQRPSEPLVLRQAGVMLAVGDTLVVGLAGRLAGLNPLTGSVRWEAPVASPRGINDVERLVDLVGPASRLNSTVCVRAFQASVGCVNAERGALLWTQTADGSTGLAGDDKLVFGVESDDKVMAWRRSDGERAWTNETLRYRDLTAPQVMGRSIAIGDSAGFVHWLSREDGKVLGRISTDGSAIATPPTLVGDTLVVVTRAGNVFGFQPQ